MPSAINENGVVVGTYVVGNFENPPHGFILQNGTYKTLPNSALATDINKFGTMVSRNAIVYKNGSYKVVKAAGCYLNETNVNGINDPGIVTGIANFQGANNTFHWKAFTARCK